MSDLSRHPKISIVTPSFNQGEFLETCIRSVLDQKYPDLEYLILDGGSTDASVDVIRKYEKHLGFWVSEKDNGQADAINRGFRRCTGDIVAWLNADDFYYPGALQTAADAWHKNPSASFYFGRCMRVDEKGAKKSEFVSTPRLIFNREALIFGLNYIAQPSTFISRKMLEAVGYLDPELKWGLDTDLWIRLSGLAAPMPIEAMLSASREHTQTKTSSGSFTRIEELRQLAARHGGGEMSPGAVCYLLDTLYKVVLANPDVYAPSYRAELTRFWASTSALFARFGADPSGTPVGPAPKAFGKKQA